VGVRCTVGAAMGANAIGRQWREDAGYIAVVDASKRVRSACCDGSRSAVCRGGCCVARAYARNAKYADASLSPAVSVQWW
jgi:MoaA/NifB/PqqE/SkfB family radical SAM enzyme